jgi:hypothetical protein
VTKRKRFQISKSAGNLMTWVEDTKPTEEEERFYKILDFEDRLDFDATSPDSSLKALEEHNRKKWL